MTIAKDVIGTVKPLLHKQGFTKRSGEVFTTELTKNVLGWLGLNRAGEHRLPFELEINPVVGVRNQLIERIVAELRGVKYHAYQPPTVNVSIGYLFPNSQYRAWVFTKAHMEDTATEMVSAISAYALPFMQGLVDLKELIDAMDSGLGFEHQLTYRRPVACLMAGKAKRSIELLSDSLERITGRNDTAAKELRLFADAFRRKCSK